MEKEHLGIMDLAHSTADGGISIESVPKQVIVSPPDQGYVKKTGNGILLMNKSQSNTTTNKANTNMQVIEAAESQNNKGVLRSKQAVTTKSLLITNFSTK